MDNQLNKIIAAISVGLVCSPLIQNNYGISRQLPYNISENNDYSKNDQLFFTKEET